MADTTHRRGGLPGWFADRRLRTKLLVLATVLFAGAAGIGLTAVVKLSELHTLGHSVYAANLVPASQLADVRTDLGVIDADTNFIVISNSEARQTALQAAVAAAIDDLDAKLAAYAAIADPGRQRELVDRFTEAWTRYKTVHEKQLMPEAVVIGDSNYEQVYNKSAVPLLATARQTLKDLSDYDVAEAAAADASGSASYRDARLVMLVLLAATLLAGAVFAFSLARSITTPVSRVARVLDALAAGDLTRRADVHSRDEIGHMAHALDTATASLRTTLHTVDTVATELSASSDGLSGVSARIAELADSSTRQAATVADAAAEVNNNVVTLTGGAEEMGASIREIAGNAAEAAQVASQAVLLNADTSTTMSKLAASSQEIGAVLNMINAIAEQTNLLALNATIEAARAGESGKGFAVVASEVKDLAQETAKATQNIARVIETIQSDSHAAVGATAQIGEIITRISEYQTTIASAVEEQTATTSEMTRGVSAASSGTKQIGAQITAAADAAESTKSGVGQVSQSAATLATLAGRLRQSVSTFTL